MAWTFARGLVCLGACVLLELGCQRTTGSTKEPLPPVTVTDDDAGGPNEAAWRREPARGDGAGGARAGEAGRGGRGGGRGRGAGSAESRGGGAGGRQGGRGGRTAATRTGAGAGPGGRGRAHAGTPPTP